MAVFDKSRINELTIKHMLGTLTPGEKAELDRFLDGEPDRRRRFNERVARTAMQHSLEAFLEAEKRRKRRASRRGQRLRVRRLMPYAAAVLLLAAAGIYWLKRDRLPVVPANPLVQTEQDILPGSNKAILTLDDGTRVDLNAAQLGAVSEQGQAQVIKTDSASLAYNDNSTSLSGRKPGHQLTYNVVATPRGGTYQVVLSDGSKAWLNAASSIRFPTSFAAGGRDVEVTGEVYFEVKPNAAAPFRVRANGTMVQVLGTEFNIRAYQNEPAEHITLVSGAVIVSEGKNSVQLAPGQQAVLSETHAVAVVQNPDIDQAIAWRTGFFKFKNADIRTVMREVERWYDISVSYQVTDFSATYGGRISRNLKLSELLHLLEENHIHHYKMEGKQLVILP